MILLRASEEEKNFFWNIISATSLTKLLFFKLFQFFFRHVIFLMIFWPTCIRLFLLLIRVCNIAIWTKATKNIVRTKKVSDRKYINIWYVHHWKLGLSLQCKKPVKMFEFYKCSKKRFRTKFLFSLDRETFSPRIGFTLLYALTVNSLCTKGKNVSSSRKAFFYFLPLSLSSPFLSLSLSFSFSLSLSLSLSHGERGQNKAVNFLMWMIG